MAVSRTRKDGRPCEASRASATMSWDHSRPAASTSSTTAARGPTHLSRRARFQPHEYPSRTPQSKRSDVDATQSGARLTGGWNRLSATATTLTPRSVMAARVVLTTRMTSVVTRPPSSITMTAPSGAAWISLLSCGPEPTRTSVPSPDDQRCRHAAARDCASSAGRRSRARNHTQSGSRSQLSITPASRSATYDPGGPRTTENGASAMRWTAALTGPTAARGRRMGGRNMAQPTFSLLVALVTAQRHRATS